MTNYTRIRRQILALLAGVLIAIPVALVAVINTPSDAPSFNIGAAGHTQYGPVILAIIGILHAASFLATALNSPCGQWQNLGLLPDTRCFFCHLV